MVKESRGARDVIRSPVIFGRRKGLRNLAAVGLLASAALQAGCATSPPKSLDDILSDPNRGDPNGRLQEILRTEGLVEAVSDWFLAQALDTEVDEDAEETARQLERADLTQRSTQFLSLSIPVEFMGESKTTPSCFKSYVQSVAWSLGSVIQRGVEAHVLDCDDPNAFSLGYGQIGICRGFLPELETDDELAFVLAHEMAHAALYHNDLLISAEADLRTRQLLFGGAVLATTAVIDAAVFASVAPSIDHAATELERNLGVSAEEDDSNDLDMVLLGSGLVGTTILTAGTVFSIANSTTKAMFSNLVEGYGETKTQQELDADRVGLEILGRAGYSERAAAFVLSRTWQSSYERGRTFAGGAAATRSGRMDLFSMAGIHPSIERRLGDLTSFATPSETMSRSSLLDYCTEEEVTQLVDTISTTANFSIKTDQALSSMEPSWESYCDEFRAFAEDNAYSEGDSIRAIQVMRGSMLCGTLDYTKAIYAPYVSGQGSSVDYETALAAFEAWVGDSAGAYALLGRLADRATRSIQVYRSALPILRRMGLTELAKAPEHACRGQTQNVETVRFSDVCSLPIAQERSTVFGAGLAWEQVGILLLDSGFIPASTTVPTAARIKKNRYLAIERAKESGFGEEKFCPGSNSADVRWSFSERVTINPFEDDVTPDWIKSSTTCLTPIPLPKPERKLLGFENPFLAHPPRQEEDKPRG